MLYPVSLTLQYYIIWFVCYILFRSSRLLMNN